MGDIVPLNKLEQEIAEIKWELIARDTYRSGGRPCPQSLPDVRKKMQAIERMEAELRRQANIELTDQVLAAMRGIGAAHYAAITSEAKRNHR